MRITIQSVSEELRPDVHALIRRKARALSRFLPALKDAVVEVRHDHHHRKGKVVSIEVSLHLFCHGNLPIRATETGLDVHGALDCVLEKLKRQLSTHREKDRGVSKKVIREARGK